MTPIQQHHLGIAIYDDEEQLLFDRLVISSGLDHWILGKTDAEVRKTR